MPKNFLDGGVGFLNLQKLSEIGWRGQPIVKGHFLLFIFFSVKEIWIFKKFFHIRVNIFLQGGRGPSSPYNLPIGNWGNMVHHCRVFKTLD